MKIIGIAAVMISALLFGNFKSGSLKKRLSVLKKSEKLIYHIEELTRLRQKSLTDILCDRETDTYGLEYITAFRENLSFSDQPQAIEKAIFETNDLLTADDKIFFSEFYKSLGKNSLEKELEIILVFVERLKKRIDGAEKEYAEKGNLYRKLSALTGLLAAVFLI